MFMLFIFMTLYVIKLSEIDKILRGFWSSTFLFMNRFRPFSIMVSISTDGRAYLDRLTKNHKKFDTLELLIQTL